MTVNEEKCKELRRDKLIYVYFEKFLHYISVLGALVGKTAIDETIKRTQNTLLIYWMIAVGLILTLIILYVITYYSTRALSVRIHELEKSCESK